MLLALLAAAALAGAEPTDAVNTPSEGAAATAEAPKAKAEKTAKPKKVCIKEKPTGSHRTQTTCYDPAQLEASREAFRNRDMRGGEAPASMGAR